MNVVPTKKLWYAILSVGCGWLLGSVLDGRGISNEDFKIAGLLVTTGLVATLFWSENR